MSVLSIRFSGSRYELFKSDAAYFTATMKIHCTQFPSKDPSKLKLFKIFFSLLNFIRTSHIIARRKKKYVGTKKCEQNDDPTLTIAYIYIFYTYVTYNFIYEYHTHMCHFLNVIKSFMTFRRFLSNVEADGIIRFMKLENKIF